MRPHVTKALKGSLLGVLASAFAAALLVPSLASGTSASTYTVTTSQSELTAIKAVKWTSNVTTSIGNGSWTFKSTGLPSSNFYAAHYAVPSNPFDVSAAGASVVTTSTILKDQSYDYTLPLKPEYSKTTTTTNQGPIGFLLDGAALYNPYEANHATVATSDNFITTKDGVSASFLDNCDSHPGPGGQFHYHGLPTCLVAYAAGGHPTVSSVTSLTGSTTASVSETNAISKKPVILGFAFDGFGIYDNVAMNGKTVPVSALDACNGIFSPVPGYAKGVYHYVLENVKGARSSIGCYRGVVSSAYTQALKNALDPTSPPPPTASTNNLSSPATAQSLAANVGEDKFLMAMLVASGIDKYC